METPKKDKGRGVIDIIATANECEKIYPDILAFHARSGCDTVAAFHGIGKPTALNTVRDKNLTFPSICKLSSNIEYRYCFQKYSVYNPMI